MYARLKKAWIGIHARLTKNAEPQPMPTLHAHLLKLPGGARNIIHDYINIYEPAIVNTAIVNLDTNVFGFMVDAFFLS